MCIGRIHVASLRPAVIVGALIGLLSSGSVHCWCTCNKRTGGVPGSHVSPSRHATGRSSSRIRRLAACGGRNGHRAAALCRGPNRGRRSTRPCRRRRARRPGALCRPRGTHAAEPVRLTHRAVSPPTHSPHDHFHAHQTPPAHSPPGNPETRDTPPASVAGGKRTEARNGGSHRGQGRLINADRPPRNESRRP